MPQHQTLEKPRVKYHTSKSVHFTPVLFFSLLFSHESSIWFEVRWHFQTHNSGMISTKCLWGSKLMAVNCNGYRDQFAKTEQNRLHLKKNLLLTIRPLTFSCSGKHSREEGHLWQNAVKMCVPQVQDGTALEEDSPWSAFLGVWRWVLSLLLLPLKNFCFETRVSLNSELTDSTEFAGWWAPGVHWALPFQNEDHRSMLPNPAFHGNSGNSELWSSCVCGRNLPDQATFQPWVNVLTVFCCVQSKPC